MILKKEYDNDCKNNNVINILSKKQFEILEKKILNLI